MQEGKVKQKCQSKPVISKKKLPKEFFENTYEKQEAISPKRKSSKETIKLNKVLKHLDRMPDQSTERLFEPFSNLPEKKPAISPIKLDEMITLSQISSSDLASSVRKVLHCRTLTLFSVKQIPMKKRQEREFLEDWIEKWKSYKNPSFVKIIETFRNSPEGCLSIVSEYQNAGSLMDLTKAVGGIPELPLSQIAKFLLDAAEWMELNNTKFISLKPSQVLFDRKGNMKISSGISRKTFVNQEENSVFMIGVLLIKAVFDENFELKQKNCCYFHSIDSNPIFLGLSTSCQDFLCGMTKFENNFTVAKAKAHPWLGQSEYNGAWVSLAEIIRIEFKGFESKNDDASRAGNMQLSRICEALRVVLAGGKFSFPDSASVENLAKELGVPKEELKEQLKAVYREVEN